MKTSKPINNPKGQTEDYSKIFNVLSALSVVGILFIAVSIPALAEDPAEEVELITPLATTPKFTVTMPDVSYAIEAKEDRDIAKSHIDTVAGIMEMVDSVEPELAPPLEYVGEFYITMYAATVEQCGNDLGITASGRKCTDDPKCHTVAVDPSVIPLGSYLIIDGYPDIVFRADDTGSAINGYDIDIFTTSESESKQFANQSNVKVWIIKDYEG
jgi:3D (Asp-Asp-Asp) domain-containing protein